MLTNELCDQGHAVYIVRSEMLLDHIIIPTIFTLQTIQNGTDLEKRESLIMFVSVRMSSEPFEFTAFWLQVNKSKEFTQFLMKSQLLTRR